jgi:hypothetical protein
VSEVQLAAEGDTHLGDDSREVVGCERSDAVVELGGEEGDEVEVGVDEFAEVRALELHGDELAVAAEPAR